MNNLPFLTPAHTRFCKKYDIKFPLYLGAMANGIASEALVSAASDAGYMAIFGSAGLSQQRVNSAIDLCLQQGYPHRIGFNVIHAPDTPHLEQALIQLLIDKKISIIEASAFITPSPALALYKASGLSFEDGKVVSRHRIIAKLSRPEVAEKFLLPAHETHLNRWVEAGLISHEQRNWAKAIPLADDITVEADSGGHTDRQAMVSVLPMIIALRDHMCASCDENVRPFIGVGGGIGTPQSILAAFALGAEYVVTGSINQCTVESGTSAAVKEMLALARTTDTTMAASADMFEMGTKVQVLKGKTLFAPRAEKLFQLYGQFNSFEEIPEDIRSKIATQYIGESWDAVWEKCVSFWSQRNPSVLALAEANPKKKLALLFKYYLGMSSRWAIEGTEDKASNYQIWCGQSMGAFNAWVKETPLAHWENRTVATITDALVSESFQLFALHNQYRQGIPITPSELQCKPKQEYVS
jgi:trans-AT polyketide synthase/acyltransferase/oxidoreductase domain-containing protein